MTKIEKIQISSNIATIVGVTASIVVALFSQCTSSEALRITKDLKAQTERVNIVVRAEFDELERVILLLPDSTRRNPVLQLYAKLDFENNNPYRAIRIDDVYPTFGPSSKPSELEMIMLQNGKKSTQPFSVASLETVERKTLIEWPIETQLANFVSNLLKTNKNLNISDLKLAMGRQPDVQRSNKNRKITLHVQTTPVKQSGDKIISTLTLHN